MLGSIDRAQGEVDAIGSGTCIGEREGVGRRAIWVIGVYNLSCNKV